MNFKDNFSDCSNGGCVPVFKQKNVPVFQNKVYPTVEEAKMALVADVELVQSLRSGFVFNKIFNPDLMNYDINYQNEQSNSLFFQNHLKDVLRLLKTLGIGDKKVVEIGCGKGVFFEIMLEEGIDCTGFDPTYEGNNPRIIKEYFTEEYSDINADVIIMRHTLEHIPNPFSFVHTIAKANNYKGFLFVEVPTFDWIVEKNAFWDIFYEHCNYFTESSLGSMFEEALTGHFFGGQYIYLWADLSKLRREIPEMVINRKNNLNFDAEVERYRALLSQNKTTAIWGAGAKGSTFLNLMDPEKKQVQYVIDINPLKQGKYIAHTGHPIYSPDILTEKPVENIIIMNENYWDEIKSRVGNINMYKL
ncbi:MAG: methyltransferase domain-containing protein [Bacteroidia bacterium]|nr:methyltransferase domain-containing protein [Bacteroidia bacterium]